MLVECVVPLQVEVKGLDLEGQREKKGVKVQVQYSDLMKLWDDWVERLFDEKKRLAKEEVA